MSEAASLLSEGRNQEAKAAYQAILKEHPESTEAQDGEVRAAEKLALAARAAQDMNGALGELLEAQKFAPASTRLLYDLGVLEDEIGLYRDADTTAGALQKLAPGDSKVAYLVARIKLDLGQLPEAETAMQAYLKAQPADPTAHYGMGRIFQLRGDNVQARAEFKQSLALKPEQTESHYQLADIAVKSDQFSDAIAEAAQVLARDSHHGGALTDTGIAYFRLKQYDKAESFLQQAVIAKPQYQPGHYYLGLTLARLGRKQESDSELATATRLADEENARSSQRMRLNDHP